MPRKKNQIRPKQHPDERFTVTQVLAIRKQAAQGYTRRELANAYRCAPLTISRLLKGQTYARVRDDVDAPALPVAIAPRRDAQALAVTQDIEPPATETPTTETPAWRGTEPLSLPLPPPPLDPRAPRQIRWEYDEDDVVAVFRCSTAWCTFEDRTESVVREHIHEHQDVSVPCLEC